MPLKFVCSLFRVLLGMDRRANLWPQSHGLLFSMFNYFSMFVKWKAHPQYCSNHHPLVLCLSVCLCLWCSLSLSPSVSFYLSLFLCLCLSPYFSVCLSLFISCVCMCCMCMYSMCVCVVFVCICGCICASHVLPHPLLLYFVPFYFCCYCLFNIKRKEGRK